MGGFFWGQGDEDGRTNPTELVVEAGAGGECVVAWMAVCVPGEVSGGKREEITKVT